MNLDIVVDGRFEQGWQLIQTLEAAGFPLKAAFWSPVGEREEWRLFLASPMVDEEGPLKTYQAVHTELDKVERPQGRPTQELELWHISVIGLNHELFKELKANASWAIRKKTKKFVPDIYDLTFADDKLVYKLGA